MCSQNIWYLVNNKILFQKYAEHIVEAHFKMHSFINISLNGDCEAKDLLMYGK